MLSMKQFFFSGTCLLSCFFFNTVECAQNSPSQSTNVIEVSSPENLNLADFNKNPLLQYKTWLQNAVDQKVNFPYIIIITTYHGDYGTRSRIMHVSRIDDQGIIFYANVNNKTLIDLPESARASGVINWYFPATQTMRQIQIQGTVKSLKTLPTRTYLYENKTYEVSEKEFLFTWDAATFSSTRAVLNMFDGAVQSIHYEKSKDKWNITKNPVFFY